MTELIAQVQGGVGLLTLNRPTALNALSLSMIRELTAVLLAWRDDASVAAVAVRGMGKAGPFGVFCAGGDLRFFHRAVLAGDPQLEDFFTEEYELNHLIHTFPKPYLAFLDGIAMGGGLGISGQGRSGGSLRIVTERTRMAMPETNIGLFPDVGGGHFLGRCPGRVGEYLALTGHVISGADAIAAGLADRLVASASLPAAWEALAEGGLPALEEALDAAPEVTLVEDVPAWPAAAVDRHFALGSVVAIVGSLEADRSPWAAETLTALHQRSPLMLHVTLEQLRRARGLSLADDLRMERGMMRRCFHLRPGPAGETMEGIRALVVDKDQKPRWNPERIEAVTPEMVAAFFDSPWPAAAHPLRHLV